MSRNLLKRELSEIDYHHTESIRNDDWTKIPLSSLCTEKLSVTYIKLIGTRHSAATLAKNAQYLKI